MGTVYDSEIYEDKIEIDDNLSIPVFFAGV